MNPAQRTCILDLWVKGYSSNQIARHLGISRNVVLGHVYRARYYGDPRAVRRMAA